MKNIFNLVPHLLNLTVITLAFSDGVGTRGTGHIFRTQTEVTSIQVHKMTAHTVEEIFKANGAFVKNILNIYVSKQQLAFEKGPHLKTLMPNSLPEWVAIRAGNLITRLEQTQWKLAHNNDRPSTALEYYYAGDNIFEIESSTSSLEAPLNAGDINEALSHFLLSAGAPFSYEEIYSELLPSIQVMLR